ncbi:HK97 gp10 family phage protein [Rhizorhabdus wittichii]|uniref:HK97 gp10 family phage protein n=1 Tax=Rhizorhabdus wittichii TaxID=160791 RepID=A0A975D0V4_9SPHN|nr:HK97-gp10 family putative phage morphogenesis protein [Rhizorhabdus wittichii]QTH20808.1 HK97 gp10 family phage protein [Rhizorhabdus wittichii]
MAKIRGAKEHAARLRRLGGGSGSGGAIAEGIGDALFAGADLIKADAQVSITAGSRSGRMVKGVLRGKYQASAPGEPPAYDTHDLANSIESARLGPLHAQVTANDRKAAWLEFGTSKMAERPYMRPAVAKNRKEVVEMVRQAVNKVIRRK